VDVLVACILMIVAVPIIAVLAILVKRSSPGPAFYSQKRMGQGGRPFQIWKLRTMLHNCEAITGPVWSGKNDNRVTHIGRILRDTHLDELPQLWNVLRGDMSLVGPRPERAEIARRIEANVPEFALRLRVKPGLTGLAQLRVPPDVDIANVPHKLAQDLYYLRHQSLLLDLRILISTAFHFIGTGCACVSELLLAGSHPSVEQEMTQPEMVFQPSRNTNSIPAAEPELSIGLGELSVAA
jgi:lipopolysaccharide/colanic/teichoic acid biosynthesis glycosyltransferase